jgi:hypothetical protein
VSRYSSGSDSVPPTESVTTTLVRGQLPVFVTVIVDVKVSLTNASGVQLRVSAMCGSSTRKLSVLLSDSLKAADVLTHTLYSAMGEMS